MVDSGVRFDSKLTFRDYISEKNNKAYSVLRIIKRNFIYMDEHTFVLLYKSIVRSHIEFVNSVWCPFQLGDLRRLKRLKKATKLIINLKTNPIRKD